ncbi:hypothetical protein [Spiroplasma diminutum]|uniref:Transmembrane protein n=1 Tax=Spiroplasma diminutum CUAS-1 TaxID=1276221 RepID=S5ME31_9MOLU|nr:hypothetical protein [Spiroplasma diminutum]AGR41983.1 hypothetical protein SDIMI_v3c02790 [Spiroplasma diminutum CUAS-1]
MKKFSIQLVFICFLFFMYYFYSAWVTNLKEVKNDLMFELFDPFKLILLGMIFTVIYAAIKNLLFSRFVNLKQYRKNLRDNILFEFDNTISYLEALKVIIKDNNQNEAKKSLKTFKTIVYKPDYLSDFMEKLANSLLLEKDISVFNGAVEVISTNIKQNFENERERILNNQRGLKEINAAEDYYTNTSWESIRYNLALNNFDNSKSSRWKISSLYISKFKSSLFISFLISSLIFVIAAVFMKINKVSIDNYFFAGFTGSILLISLAHYNISMFLSSKKMNIKIYWGHLVLYYTIITVIFLNITLNIIFFPNVATTTQEGQWYNSELLNFLKNLLYIVFSTMLLAYVFGGFLELLEDSKFNLKNSVKTFVAPLVIFIITLVINILSIYHAESSYYVVNFTILTAFWLFISVWNKFFSK